MTDSAEPKIPQLKMEDHLRNLSNLLRENKAEDAKRLLLRVPDLLDSTDEDGRKTAHFASVAGCLPILQFAISTHKNQADTPDEMGWSPLMIAASAGRLEVVNYLLSLPEVDVNRRNSNGQTALHYSTSKNHKDITYLLLKNGANVNAVDKYGATALHRAASQGHDQIVNMFLAHPKTHIDARNSEGNSPLFLACEELREDSAIALAAKGANLELQNADGNCPLDVVKTASLRTKLKKAAERADK